MGELHSGGVDYEEDEVVGSESDAVAANVAEVAAVNVVDDAVIVNDGGHCGDYGCCDDDHRGDYDGAADAAVALAVVYGFADLHLELSL